MDNKKYDNETTSMWDEAHDSGFRLVIPFFAVMAILTVVSYMIPLRPTQSVMEKRNLAQFPEFSVEAVVSGDYFDGISTWFSDTFPGREQWLQVASFTTSLHGHSDIYISNDNISMSIVDTNDTPEETVPAVTQPDEEDTPAATEQAVTEPTATEAADENLEIFVGQAIQVGDSMYNTLEIDEEACKFYIEVLSSFADRMADQNVRVISAPPPTAAGIMLDSRIQEKIGCASQEMLLHALHDPMGSSVITVDTYDALMAHRDEYIYFHTDHHWTALGAYYAYKAICQAADLEPAPLDSFEILEQGDFQGSLYWKAMQPQKLASDYLTAYLPQGDIEAFRVNEFDYHSPIWLVRDMREALPAEKYLGFHEGDHGIVEVTNHSIPDAPNCIVIKDSFGNAMIPFLTQNYHTVIAMDYRIYYSGIPHYIEKYNVSDVIFMPYLIATQDFDANRYLNALCK